jgi:ribosome-binding factor A
MKKKNKSSAHVGASQRQLKVGEVLRRTLSDIFIRRDLYDPELSEFNITITEVTVSPDLRNATVYFLPLGGQNASVALKFGFN